MNRACAPVFSSLLLVVACESGYAYDVGTHLDMSRAAARSSVLVQGSVLQDLGFSKSIDDSTQIYPSTPGPFDKDLDPECQRGIRLSILQLIGCGSQFEDVPGGRSLNHFFDPANFGRALTVTLVGALGKPLPDWALKDNNTDTTQEFAYRDARAYFYDALKSPEESDRDTKWGKLFQTIGQVIHHPQDLAQPQHVRNDPHCHIPPCLFADLVTLGIFGIYNPSRFEKYTSFGVSFLGGSVRGQVQQLADGADGNVVYPGPNNANISVFNGQVSAFVEHLRLSVRRTPDVG